MGTVRRILVVEDSEECAATIDIALGALGGGATTVVDRAEMARRGLDTGGIDLLITDIHLPAMSGLDLVRRVRQDRRHGRIPILVISGDAAPDTPELARTAGATAYFHKPYSPAAVRRKVEELIHAF